MSVAALTKKILHAALFYEIWDAMKVTFRHMLHRPMTFQYPREHRTIPDTHRGALGLLRGEAHRGIRPGYEQKRFEDAEKRGRLRLVGSRDGRDGSITIHQDVDLYAGLFEPGEAAHLDLRPGRHAWIQVARGEVTVNGETLRAGDGAAVSDESALDIDATADAEILVFDLA